jgi:hypothetical protein
MMTQSEFRRIESLLRVCAINVTRCQEVVTRSSALVERAKQLIEVCQQTLKHKEMAALKSIKSSQQAARASEQLLAVQKNQSPGFAERLLRRDFVGPLGANQQARDQDLLR